MILLLLACSSPAPEPTPAADPAPKVEVVPRTTPELTGTAERAVKDDGTRAAGSAPELVLDMVASSTHTVENDVHAADALRDANPLTAWMPEADAKEAKVTFSPAAPSDFPKELGIIPGFAQSEESWAAYGRPTKLTLRVRHTVNVAESLIPTWRDYNLTVPADAAPLKPIYFAIENDCESEPGCSSLFDAIEIIVTDSAAGTEHSQVAISEVMFY